MATVLLIVVAAVLALAVALTVRRLRAVRDADRRALEAQRIAAEADHERLEAQLRRLHLTVNRHSETLARVRRAWQAEREWSRELRSQIGRLGQDRPGFGRSGANGDVRELVLQAAIKLVEGDRGLLLSREDRDDGDLDVVVARGFEHDPGRSALAQRFAREVLDRDRIVREDAPAEQDPGDDRTPADHEIASLVAIPLYLRDRFEGVVVVANREGGFEDVEDDVLLALGDHAAAALQHGHLRHALQDANRAAVRILVEAVAAGDPVLHRESSQLSVYAIHLARELRLDEREREVLVCAVLLRAVGYLALPERVLLKPGPLSDEERALVELHPRIAFNIIGQAPVLRDVATTVLYHQERFDGTGYPAGLVGADIPRLARALAVLEAFAAMTHERTYRDARSIEDGCQALAEGGGTQFDPEIAELFVEEVRRSAGAPSSELAGAVVESLPFDPVAAAQSVLGPLGGPATDGLTLLGDHRALQQGVREAVQATSAGGRPYALALLQIEGLDRINEDASFVVGDRVIHVAARNAGRVAVRLGGTAYRASGRRLALLVPLRDGVTPERIATEISAEFAGGPELTCQVVASEPGERGEHLIARARQGLAAAT
jgi:GGDEF domain-containing protein